MAADFQAILFDNDGVLVDTERLYYQANREILASVGVALDEAAYLRLFLQENRGAWHLAEALGVTPAEINQLRTARDRRYHDLIEQEDVVVPGVRELLPRLAARYRMAIVTSSEAPAFARIHARSGLLPHFEFALTRSDYVNSKPDPEPYLCAVARLGLAPERCLVIEDSERGLRAAKAASLQCWVIPSSLSAASDFSAADAILPDLFAIEPRLLERDSDNITGPWRGSMATGNKDW